MTFIKITILTIFFISCSKNQNENSIVINTQELIRSDASAENLNGGLLFYAISNSSNLATAVELTTSNISLSLPNGDWTFIAIGWLGPSTFSGQAKCFLTQRLLNGGAHNLNLVLSQANCNSTAFATNSYRLSQVFKNLRFIQCMNFTTIQNSNECIKGTSSILSYKIDLITFTKLNTTAPLTITGKKQVCINHTASQPLHFPTGGTLPYFLSGNLELHGNANCTQPIKNFPFAKGLSSLIDTTSTHFKFYNNTNSIDMLLPATTAIPASTPQKLAINSGAQLIESTNFKLNLIVNPIPANTQLQSSNLKLILNPQDI